jgi:hypothetical protein
MGDSMQRACRILQSILFAGLVLSELGIEPLADRVWNLRLLDPLSS